MNWFSQVIKEHFPSVGATAGDLLEALVRTEVSEDTLRAVEQVVGDRRNSPVRVPRW